MRSQECFNSPYGVKYFPEYCEPIPDGPTIQALSQAARDHGVYLIGGSIPEKDGDRLYNTCPVFDPSGSLIAKHRKVHLFDIDIPGKITFKESTNLSPGNELTIVNTGRKIMKTCGEIEWIFVSHSIDSRVDSRIDLYSIAGSFLGSFKSF